MSKPTMNEPLKEFWKTKSRYKCLYGGRASSKSYNTALHLINLTSKYSLKVLCARQFQNNIRESVYTLLKDIIWDMGLQNEYQILQNTIRHINGSQFIFYGLSRNISEVKSLEGISICWLEEAHNITKEQFEVLDPTIRKEDSEIWLTFNPQHRGDWVFQNFVEKPRRGSIVKKINYDDNPFISDTMLTVINTMREDDYEEYKHIYLGDPLEGDDRSLFAYSDIEKAMDENLMGVDTLGVSTLAVDVARYGKDSSVTSRRDGYRIYNLQVFKGYDTMELAAQVSNLCRIPFDAVVVDTIGVGAGVFDKLKQMGVRPLVEGNASMKPTEVKVYQNKRAEMYFGLKKFVENGGKIPNDPELKEELLAMTYFYNQTSGKIQIVSKDDLKEDLGRSPDKADSVALHFFRQVRAMSMRNNQGGQGYGTSDFNPYE